MADMDEFESFLAENRDKKSTLYRLEATVGMPSSIWA